MRTHLSLKALDAPLPSLNHPCLLPPLPLTHLLLLLHLVCLMPHIHIRDTDVEFIESRNGPQGALALTPT